MTDPSAQEDMYQQTLDKMVEHLAPDRALVLDGLDTSGRFIPRVAHGFNLNAVYSTEEISLTILEEIAAGFEPRVVIDALSDPVYGERTSAVVTGIRSVLCCPVVDKLTAQVRGLLYADSRERPNFFKFDHLAWSKAQAAELASKLD
jgi:hypothetical protein